MVLQLCINVDLKRSKLMASLNCWHSLPTTCTSYIDERARTYKWQKRTVPRVRATIVSSKTERSYLTFTYKQSLSSYEFFFDFSRLPIEVIARVFQAALLLYFTNVFLTVLGFPRSLRYRRDLSRQSERRRNHDEGKNLLVYETIAQFYYYWCLVSLLISPVETRKMIRKNRRVCFSSFSTHQ